MKSRRKNQYILKMTLFFGAIMALLLVSLSAFWLNRVIFNTEQFTSLTLKAFSEQSSRESVGDMVADRIFENTPALKAVLSDRVSGYVAGLLGTDTARNSVERLARQSQLVFTSPRRDPVVLDLASWKTFVVSAQEVVQKDETQRRINADDIPDTVTIIDTSKLPNIHTTSVYVHIAGPLSLLAAIGLAGYWLWRGGKNNSYKRVRILMLVVIASSGVAVIIGPLAEPSFVSIGRDAASQTLLSNLYVAFISPFRNMALWTGSVALVLLLATTAWHEANQRYTLLFKITKK